jgi:hypothetical protein
MANFDSLKAAVNESKATLESAAKAIRKLIVDRNNVFAATSPERLEAAAAETRVQTTAEDLQTSLEAARKDCEEAIKEAGAAPKATPVAPGPATGTTPATPAAASAKYGGGVGPRP